MLNILWDHVNLCDRPAPTRCACDSLCLRVLLLAAVEVELERHRHVSLQSLELQRAFMKPKTTVVEIRAMERGTT